MGLPAQLIGSGRSSRTGSNTIARPNPAQRHKARAIDTENQALALVWRHHLFAALNEEQRATLADAMSVRHLDTDEMLFWHGEPADRFFVVGEGRVKLFRDSRDGRQKVIEVIMPGQSFAEAVMFMAGSSFPVSAQALEASVVLEFPNEVFRGLLANSPEACFRMLGALSQRLHARLNEIESLAIQNATYRVIHYLLGLAPSDTERATISLPGHRQLVASQLAIEPETLSRILSNLAHAGLIRVSGRQITIVDVERLRGAY